MTQSVVAMRAPVMSYDLLPSERASEPEDRYPPGVGLVLDVLNYLRRI